METYLAGLGTHILPILCIFLAAFLQSVTGFGLVIVAAPLLMLFYDPKLTVPIMLLLACCGNFAQGIWYRRDANFRLIACLYIGVLLGMPAGFAVFSQVPGDVLKLLINGMILFSLILMQISHKDIRQCRRNTVITGFFSGFASITTGMGGPPFLIYLAKTTMTLQAFRATCFVFFFTCNATSLIMYLCGGLPLAPAAHEFIYLLPALALGIAAGHLIYRHIPIALLRRLIFFILYAASIYTIIRVLLKYIA